MNTISIYLLLLGLCLSPSVSAKMYRWIDQNGQVVYSQKAPEDNISVKEIKAPRPPSIDATELKEKKRIKREAFEKKRQNKLDDKKKREKKEQDIKQRTKNCDIAKKNYAAMKTYSPRLVTGADGRRTRLNKTQQQINKAKAKAKMDQFCP